MGKKIRIFPNPLNIELKVGSTEFSQSVKIRLRIGTENQRAKKIRTFHIHSTMSGHEMPKI